MTDHAVVVPTQHGPVGAVVSEPRAEQQGALILLQGGGPPCRAGVNALFTRIARDLAGLGLAVLRFDFATEGDSTLVGRDAPREMGWRRSVDLGILRDVAPWFLSRAGERELLLAGVCHGARVALELAASDASAKGLFMVVPYLLNREPHVLEAADEGVPPALAGRTWSGGNTLDSDEALLEGLRSCLARGPVWILAGEGEDEAVRPFERALESAARPLELELFPGMALHPTGHPAQQAVVRERLVARVARAVSGREDRVPSLS
jgi:dienelactone hydrolase